MNANGIPQDELLPEVARPPYDLDADNGPPWEMIENGRYRPRRIKGSCVGRELG